mgnify:CR=1 FL=1
MTRLEPLGIHEVDDEEGRSRAEAHGGVEDAAVVLDLHARAFRIRAWATVAGRADGTDLAERSAAQIS